MILKNPLSLRPCALDESSFSNGRIMMEVCSLCFECTFLSVIWTVVGIGGKCYVLNPYAASG